MKKIPGFIACSVGLTVVFYLLAYYLLPPPPPTAGMVLLFAAVAMAIIWAFGAAIKKFRARRSGGPGSSSTGGKAALAFLVLGALSPFAIRTASTGSVIAAEAEPPSQHSSKIELSTVCKFMHGPRMGTTQDYSELTPAPIGSPCTDGEGSSGIVIARDPFQNGIFQPPSHRREKDGKERGRSPGSGISQGKSSPPSSSRGGGPRLGPPVGQGAPPPQPLPPPPPPPPPVADRPAKDGLVGPGFGQQPTPPAGARLRRVTGTAVLLPAEKEQSGYALYSYALMSQHPQDAELPKVKAYFRALFALPTAAAVERSVERSRINITYVPLDSLPPTWDALATDARIIYVVDHYDYARGAAMIASLEQRTGRGPVIISLLKPIDLSGHPHPVLLQDLTSAEPTLMASYVSYFVSQTATDQFQKDETLSTFGLKLRNALEVAATGLGMSKDAVQSWIKYFE